MPEVTQETLDKICTDMDTKFCVNIDDCDSCQQGIAFVLSQQAAPTPAPAWTDKINGGFEFIGGFFLILHILQAWHDKSVAGVNIYAVAYFTLWGYWNLYYYKSIKQRWSLVASYFITAMNTVWLSLLFYYC